MKEKLKAFLEQKKIRKDQCLILLLTGILLLVIVWPAESFAKSKEMDNTSDTIDLKKTSGDQEQTGQEYCTYWEDKLSGILSGIPGVGAVKVAVSVSETEEQVTLKDYESGERRFSEETVFITNEKGQKVPFVIKRKLPQVKGVLVVAKGAGQAAVEMSIRRAVSALFGLENSKIMVLPLK